jgi:Ca2+-binding EF-hand superfamily protein
VNNFDRVFGHPCPYFGKLLYLFLSEGFDRKKIHFLKFLEALYPVFDKDNQLNQNKIAFKILDMDRDDNLNIINLLDLQNNLSQKTPLGQEIFRLVHY